MHINSESASFSWRYLLLLIFVEVLLICIVFFGNPIVAIGFISIFVGVALFIWAYNNAKAFHRIYIFAILAGSMGAIQIGGRNPHILFVEILGIPLIIIFILKTLQLGSLDSELPVGAKLFFLFLVLAAIVSLDIVNFGRSFYMFRAYAMGLICYILAYRLTKDPRDFHSYVILLLLWGVCLTIIEFGVVLSLGGLKSGFIQIVIRKNLMTTSWGGSNYLATFFDIIIPLGIVRFFESKKTTERILMFFVLLILVTGLIITISRGGLLSTGIGVLFVLAFTMKPRNFIYTILLLIFATIVVVLNPFSQVVINGLTGASKTASYFSRVNLYNDVFNLISQNPFWGVGFGNLGYYLKFKTSDFISAHNIVLSLLVELGVFATVIFLSILVLVFFNGVKTKFLTKDRQIRSYAIGFLGALVAVYIHTLMEPNFEGIEFSIFFWSFVGVFTKHFKMSTNDKKQIVHEY